MPFPRSPARPPVLAESLILIERVRARPRPARPLCPSVVRRPLSMIAVQCWSDVCWPRILRRRDNERAREKDRIWCKGRKVSSVPPLSHLDETRGGGVGVGRDFRPPLSVCIVIRAIGGGDSVVDSFSRSFVRD